MATARDQSQLPRSNIRRPLTGGAGSPAAIAAFTASSRCMTAFLLYLMVGVGWPEARAARMAARRVCHEYGLCEHQPCQESAGTTTKLEGVPAMQGGLLRYGAAEMQLMAHSALQLGQSSWRRLHQPPADGLYMGLGWQQEESGADTE